jgi:hypothetical protein
MSYVQPTPPLRDLPQGRLALRSQHLRAELGRKPERTHRRRTALVLVAAAVLLGATLLATPALGLRDGLAHLFGADKPPPNVIKQYFTNQDPLGVKGLRPAKARLVSALAIPGFGHMTIWAAPTKDGGFCSTAASSSDCKPHGTGKFDTTISVIPLSRHGNYDNPRDVHVIVRGVTLAHGAASLAAHYEDGSVDRTPISWAGKPIGAGFFIYEIPKSHWDPGKRLVAVTVENADGQVLARDTKTADDFRDVQKKLGVALPSGAHTKPLPPPPQPTYSKTFSDPEGDAGSSVDITEVKVTEWAREIDVELTVKGNPGLQEDGPLVALDLDQNPDTGSAYFGTEAEVALVGGGDTPTLYRAHGWDFLAAKPNSGVGWMTGSEKVGFLIPRSLLGPDPEPGFNIVASSVARHPDTAPDVGTFAFEPPGSTHPQLGPDRRPPKLFAFDSLGTHGRDAKLDYWVLEGRGRTRQVIRVFRGHRLLKTIWTPLADANPFGTAETTWHVPAGLRGHLRFTVRSFDAAGNRSALATASLIVR